MSCWSLVRNDIALGADTLWVRKKKEEYRPVGMGEEICMELYRVQALFRIIF